MSHSFCHNSILPPWYISRGFPPNFFVSSFLTLFACYFILFWVILFPVLRIDSEQQPSISNVATAIGGFCRGLIRDRCTTVVAGCPKSAQHHRILLSTVLFLFLLFFDGGSVRWIHLISFPFSGTSSYYSVVSISTCATTTTTIRRRRRRRRW